MIEIKELKKTFGSFTAVDNLTFSISKKSGITGLLGPNGAGKTTIMRLLTGFLKPTSGKISINGLDPENEDDLVKIKSSIGYLPETSPLYPEMLVSEFLQFSGQIRGLIGDELEQNAREMVEKLQLGTHLYTPIGILSKGFRQRTALAGTLIHKPKIIILDEPTSGLDPNQIIEIRSLLKELGRESILMISSHILQEIEDICERVIIINHGRLTADEPTYLLRNMNACSVVIKGEGIPKKLESFSIVKNCREVEDAPGIPEEYRQFICELNEDKPETLFSKIAETGWEVREFSPVSKSLQEIFKELTT